MFKKINCLIVMLATSLAFNPVFAGLLNHAVLVENTLQIAFTHGLEQPLGIGAARVSSSSVELPSFIDSYDIDISDNSIAFNWVDTTFSGFIKGEIGASTFDRNHFVFNLPKGMSISGISFNQLSSNLLAGSALPTAELISSDHVVTIFGEGVIRDAGFSPVFDVVTAVSVPLPVPLPMSLHFMIIGLSGLIASRFRRGWF